MHTRPACPKFTEIICKSTMELRQSGTRVPAPDYNSSSGKAPVASIKSTTPCSSRDGRKLMKATTALYKNLKANLRLVMLYQCDGLVELYKAGSKWWQVDLATLHWHKASETKGDKRMTEIMWGPNCGYPSKLV